jgi:hypothetical protein
MSRQISAQEWAGRFNESSTSLEYDLFRHDMHSQTPTCGSSASRRPIKGATSVRRRHDHPLRIRFLAKTVIKVLGKEAVQSLDMKPREYERWHKGLADFNQVDREGPRLSERQLDLVLRAGAAVLQPVIPPNAALNIIADYLIAKEANHEVLMADILKDIEI